MRLKLDENLGHSVAGLFNQAGHDVSTVHEQQMAGTADEAVYRACVSEERTLVSLDLDFANPMRFDPSLGHGIAVLRVPSQPTLDDLHQAAQTLIGGLDSDSITGRLWVIRPGSIRQYTSDDAD